MGFVGIRRHCNGFVDCNIHKCEDDKGQKYEHRIFVVLF